MSSSYLPVFEFGGINQPLHLSVANGFPPETYKPLFASFLDSYRVFSVLPRALWPSSPEPVSLTSWENMADDILQGLKERDLTNVIAVGHSMGGVASTFAVIKEPSRFRALILLDPTFLPPRYVGAIALLRLFGQSRRFPLAVGARRRRARFESREEAFQYWRSKPLFEDWPDETLGLYAQSMTHPSADGNGVELTWSPHWEAHYYEKVYLRWPFLISKLRGLLPVLFIQGALTNTFKNVSRIIAHSLVPDADSEIIMGHGHLFPQTAPDLTREIMIRWIETRLAKTE